MTKLFSPLQLGPYTLNHRRPDEFRSSLRRLIEKIEGLVDIMRQRMGRLFLSPVLLGDRRRTHGHHGVQTQGRPPSRVWPQFVHRLSQDLFHLTKGLFA
jgi:hypothetical protein